MSVKAAPDASQKQQLLSKEMTDQISADVVQGVATGVAKQLQERAGELAQSAGTVLKDKMAHVWDEQVRGGKLEGPLPLRALCFLGGIGLIGVGALGLLNVFNAIFAPTAFILHAYQVFFGLLITVVEGKNLGSFFESHRERVDKYFFFLSLMGGRGALYILVGTLAVSMWSLTDLAIGIYMIFLGVVCVMVHFHLEGQLHNEIKNRIGIEAQP